MTRDSIAGGHIRYCGPNVLDVIFTIHCFKYLCDLFDLFTCMLFKGVHLK